MDVEEAIIEVFQRLREGRKKCSEEDDHTVVTGYWVGPNIIRIDCTLKCNK